MADLELGPLRFGIVGAGRLGRVIGRALQARDFSLVAATSATQVGRDGAAHALQVPVFDDPLLATVDVDVVLICAPDDAIAEVAARLAERAPSTTPYRLRVVHTSGCVSLEALEPLRAAGHDVLSMHPLQTITAASGAGAGELTGAAAAITAHDEATRTFGHALAHALNMHPFDLADEARPIYHAASAVAANFTVTMQAMVRDFAASAGLHEGMARNAFCALARSAIDRVEHEGPEAALTGPIARGDQATIAAHLAAIDDVAPQHSATYRALVHATVQLAVSSGRLPIDRAASMDQLVTAGDPS